MDKTVNLVRLVGYLGAEPKVQWYDTDSAVVRLSVATHSPSYLSEEGRECKGEVTDWHRVVCYKREAVELSKDMDTGDRVVVEGRLTYARFYGRNGQVSISTFVVAHSIELLERRREPSSQTPKDEPSRYDKYFETLEEDKDGLPF